MHLPHLHPTGDTMKIRLSLTFEVLRRSNRVESAQEREVDMPGSLVERSDEPWGDDTVEPIGFRP